MRASDARRLLARPPQGDLTEAVRQVIRGRRQTGWLSIDRVASLAGISVRTLQRRLAQEGGVFSELLDEVRTELAVQMLTTTEASLAEIAHEAGYSGVTSFIRAFRRRTGKTPAEFRQ
jgi:AraC-like DNA-binding protein